MLVHDGRGCPDVGSDIQEVALYVVHANIVVVDDIPTNTTYVAGSIKLNAAAQTDGGGDDSADYNVTNATAVTVSVGTLAPGASATITFDVTIN